MVYIYFINIDVIICKILFIKYSHYYANSFIYSFILITVLKNLRFMFCHLIFLVTPKYVYGYILVAIDLKNKRTINLLLQ